MTAAWMAYALLVGVVVALAAHAMDGVCRIARQPARWVWAAAMALTVVLIALAPQRTVRSAAVALPAGFDAAVTTTGTGEESVLERVAASLHAVRGAIETGAARGFAAAGRLATSSVERWLAATWLALSAVVLALFFGVHGRLRRAKRSWPVTELHGTRVRLAPRAGPAVVGIAQPEIVVPRWLLLRDDAEQRMVVAHEGEHLRARDPLLLTAACLVAALVAWHPAIWWMLSRLRLAVELDCDRRVVRRGFAPRRYGELLIDLAGRCTGGMRIGAPALTDGPSHLERRLIAMTSRRPKYARAAACALAVCSAVLFALACDAKLPTSEDVKSMDVSAAGSGEGDAWTFGAEPADFRADSGRDLSARRRTPLEGRTFEGVLLVDGARVANERLSSISPGEIVSVEVVKGDAARARYGRLYPDSSVANGVIEITTRPDAKEPR